MSSPEFRYCYHCARNHPREEMRQIATKGGKRWRCIKSIEATKIDISERNAYGRTVTAANRSVASARVKARTGTDQA